MPELDFDHDEEYNGGSVWPNTHTLRGLHPDTGEEVGSLKYKTPRRAKDKIKIDMLKVHPDHRGNGYGNQLMDELQQRHPKTPIDHGDRTDDGKKWWESYSRGKSVQKGRTAASRQASGVLWQRTASDGYLEPLDAAQRAMHYTHPVWNQPLGSEHDATESFRHLLRRGGHPEADDAEAFQHPSPGWHQSQLGRGDVGQLTAAIHPDRWNYGTLAHETAHALHQHASGRSTSREHAHDDDFMEHYRNVGNMVSPGAGDALHEAYHGRRLDFKEAAVQPLYHGTSVPDVHQILPASRHGQGMSYGPDISDPSYAYATTDHNDAWEYAMEAHGQRPDRDPAKPGRPRVYEVHPIGGHEHVEPDPDYEPSGEWRGVRDHDMRSPVGFHVGREMEAPEHVKRWYRREGDNWFGEFH